MILFLFLVIAGVITITQGVRKISVQYAKRVVGRKMYGGQSTFMPLKVNYAGVMPIIFAWAILLFPSTIISLLFKNSPTASKIANALNSGWVHYALIAAMIFFFSYFWVATQFQPSQIADDLKKHGGYIPGVRPGKPRAVFLGLYDDAADFRRRGVSHPDCGVAERAQRGPSCSAGHRSIFRRNKRAHYRGRNAGYDAPGRNASDSTPLRRVLAQRANSRAGFRCARGLQPGEPQRRGR
jgi:Preprotein translocase subunit SecY